MHISNESIPIYISIQSGDFVVVETSEYQLTADSMDWWIGQVVYVIGGARDPSSNSLFQIIDVDTGIIKTINADLVVRKICLDSSI